MNITAAGLAILFVSLLSADRANAQVLSQAQKDNTDWVDALPFGPLTDGSRVIVGRPGTLFEANANIPVFIWSRTRELLTGTSQGCLGKRRESKYVSGCTIVFTPRFTIRQLSEDSATSSPVRTPSFNPTIEFNRYGWEPDADGRVLHHAALRLAHYSNGQEGCFFVESDPADGCKRPTLAVGQRPTVNAEFGSFSTHYVEFDYNRARVGLMRAPGSDSTDIERKLWYVGVGVRWSPPVGGGGMAQDLADAYGRTQASFRIGARYRSGSTWRPVYAVAAEGQKTFGRKKTSPGLASSLRSSVELRVTSSQLYGFGVFVRYDDGWDSYNINFVRRVKGFNSKPFSVGAFVDHTRAIALSRDAARLILDRKR